MPPPPVGETILEVLTVVLIASLLSATLTMLIFLIERWFA
jgi:hypothetical protein